MKLPRLDCVLGITIFLFLCRSSLGGDQIILDFQKRGAQGEVGLHSRMALPVSAMYPEYTIQRSTNMVNWEAVAGPVAGEVGVSDEFLRVAVPTAGDRAFYRVVTQVKFAPTERGLGDAIYGFGTEFSRELQRLGQLSLDDFVARYGPTNQYLPQMTFDPTQAEFWNEFNIDPAVYNATNSWPNRRTRDFRLNPQEFAVFQTNGFVVSQRLERPSFADIFYDVYTDDLPVFVTTDSILHAWHRTFVTMLAEIEETCLHPGLSEILDGMAGQVTTLWTQAGGTAMTNGVLDADYFLAVARSLVSGVDNYGSLGQTARVTTTLNAINTLQPAWINLFGEPRLVDFSQFQVRGHYESRLALSRYFRAKMWCALADFRYAGFSTGTASGNSTNTLRELSGAVALEFLLTSSGKIDVWKQFNRTLEMFFGPSDSLNFAQLSDLISAAGINSPGDLPNQAALTALQQQLMSGQLGMQQIAAGYYWSPLTPEQVKLPRSFTFAGQQFAMDSWALGKCTFDNIFWDQDGIPTVADKVLRRVPSALDVAFSVLGNSQIVPELAARIVNTNGHPWRDGLPYQHNLAAARNVVDGQSPVAWTNSIYSHWLACLRELSSPTTGVEYPEVMRTRTWALKTLNTQLASWTQLRHNTVLYTKQAYTQIYLCSYPDGYVEPHPAFWGRLREMALATRAVLATLSTSGLFTYRQYSNNVPFNVTVSGATMHSNRLAVMDQFLGTTATLRAIAVKELAKTPLTPEEKLFLERLVEFDYIGAKTYTGWYPALFYRPGSQIVPWKFQDTAAPSGQDQGSDYWDALVTDVHTDPEDPIVGDPGSILHEGVGNVQLMMIAVDCGPNNLAVYAGPVLSHYEFELGPTTRRTDSEWKLAVGAGTQPPAPAWTRGFLVPTNSVP